MNLNWRAPAGLHTATARLPVEGELPSLDGATGWLNSPPLAPAGLRGKVVLASFWTYTCINWLRQLPYLRAWAAKYSANGLVVIGVHTPEFPFEHDPGNVRQAVRTWELATQLRSIATTRYGVPSLITTGLPCTSPMLRGTSGITISAKANTSSRKWSYSSYLPRPALALSTEKWFRSLPRGLRRRPTGAA